MNVRDRGSHLVDYQARALGRPAPDPLPHVKNDMSLANDMEWPPLPPGYDRHGYRSAGR